MAIESQTQNFSPGAEQALKDLGLITDYSLTGKSLENLKHEHRSGRPEAYTYDDLSGLWDNYPLLEPLGNQANLFDVTSRRTQVAFHPDPERFFLRGDGKTIPEEIHTGVRPLEYYANLVAKYNTRLRQETGRDDIQAIMGNAADWPDLIFQYNAKTGKYLFGGHYDN